MAGSGVIASLSSMVLASLVALQQKKKRFLRTVPLVMWVTCWWGLYGTIEGVQPCCCIDLYVILVLSNLCS